MARERTFLLGRETGGEAVRTEADIRADLSRRAPMVREKFRPEESPTVWFSVLQTAIRRGDEELEATARAALERLGYEVTVRGRPERQTVARERTFLLGRDAQDLCRPAEYSVLNGANEADVDLVHDSMSWTDWQPSLFSMCPKYFERTTGIKLEPGQLVRCRLEIVEDLGVWGLPE